MPDMADKHKINILLIIDNDVINQYTEYYFSKHPKAKKPPIKAPYHESINTWMIMKRMAMNGLKQRWKDFIVWYVNEKGYTDLQIEKCRIRQTVYYPTKRRHDVDNSVPKFIIDGLVESGMIVDDDSSHIVELSLVCYTDSVRPRTELHIISEMMYFDHE